MPRPMDRDLKSEMCAQLEKMAQVLERMKGQVERKTGKVSSSDDVWVSLDEALDCVRQAARVCGRA